MDKAQIKKTVSLINTRYDALIPERLRVYPVLSSSVKNRLILVVTGGKHGTRDKKRLATTCNVQQRPFSGYALSRTRRFIEDAITQLYNAHIAQTFMSDYKDALSDEGFDRNKGYCCDHYTYLKVI